MIAILAASAGAPAFGQTIAGNSLALKSTGSNVINQNGYVGTYVTLASPGTVTFTVNAQSQSGGGTTPHMNIVVDDTIAGWNVGTTASNYSTSIALPAGTHFVRTELNNYASRSLTINNLTVAGATVSNTNSNTNALNASNTYIDNFRKGTASVSLTGPGNIGLLSGMPVQADLGRHAFNFGGNVPGNSESNVNTYLGDTAVGTTAYNFQQFANSHFNMLVPSNAGKWSNNEGARDVVTMNGPDKVLSYAQAHNMRSRMHNLLWGDNSFNGQQPSWVLNNNAAPNNGLLDKAVAGDAAAATDLRGEISERIQYYMNSTRSNKYSEVDIYNESVHTPAYWNVYGASGIASIYNEVQAALNAAGSSAKIFENEYNVLQWGDSFGNWYRQHIDDIRNAGGTVSGVGIQYYPETSSNANTNSPRSASRMMSVLQGMSVEGLPMTLTEYGQQSGGTGTNTQSTDVNLHADILEESLRMVFGTPQMNGFLIWGWWAGATDTLGGNSVLVDNSWNLTTVGQRWESLMSQWDTNVATMVGADGKINFNGFLGDYYLRGQTSGAYDLALLKGMSAYSVNMAAPPTWSLWDVTKSGNWGTGGNWATGGIANASGQTAYFGAAAAPRTVTADAPKTLGMIAFNSSIAYTIAGANPITLQGFNNVNGHVAAINVALGSHAISAPLVLADNTTVHISSIGSTLTASNLQPASVALTKTGAGTLAVNNVRMGSLTVGGGIVRILPNGTASGVSTIPTLSIAAGAKLDLNDNKLITNNPVGTETAGTYNGVQGLVQSARNGGGWDGATGITTSQSAAPTGLTTIGVSTGAIARFLGPTDTTVWAGQTISGNSTLAMYTYTGDANLDGLIDGSDYAFIDFNIAIPGADGYGNGDFNYDGVIDGSDYAAIDFNIASQGAPFSTADDAALSSLIAIPEPASISMIGLAGAGLLAKRKRRRSMLGRRVL